MLTPARCSRKVGSHHRLLMGGCGEHSRVGINASKTLGSRVGGWAPALRRGRLAGLTRVWPCARPSTREVT